MISFLFVGFGGLLGAVCRYGFTVLFPSNGDFPLNTLIINILGSFLIGIIFALSDNSGYISQNAKLFFQTGFCGGFTTFSTFSLEALTLIEYGKITLGGVYIFLSVLCCIVGVMFGKMVAMSIIK